MPAYSNGGDKGKGVMQLARETGNSNQSHKSSNQE